jgi:hypothetical protein
MGLAERVSEALTSAGRLFRSGLQFFATGNVTVHNEPDHDPAVNYRLSDDSGNTTGHTEVVVQSTTPRSGSNSHSKDGLHTFEAHHAVGDVHGGVQSLDDASSNADSEDSWTFESPPLDLNYEALKHIGNYFTSGSHGRCTGISTLPRGQNMRSVFCISKTAGPVSHALPVRPSHSQKWKANWRQSSTCATTRPFRCLRSVSSTTPRITQLARPLFSWNISTAAHWTTCGKSYLWITSWMRSHRSPVSTVNLLA